jgi:Zn-dependent alcohol dehydrogenase
MRAAVFEGVGRPIDLWDIQLEAPGSGEVVVRVAACGVCHSDLSATDGTFPVPTPIVVGHEAAGVVEEVGPGVTSVRAGDHVVVSPSPPCGQCYGCVRGQPGVCVNAQSVTNFALPDGSTRLSRDGTLIHRGLGVAAFAERVLTLESGVVPIPDDVPLDVACLMGCGVQTGVGAVLNTARVEEGSTVLVIGLGGVGLSVVQGARAAAASAIVAVDPNPERRALAMALGATQTVDPAHQDPIEAGRDLTGGRGVDYAFEVVGRSALVKTCVDATRPGGTTVMVGAMGLDDPLTIDLPVLFAATEKRLVGCFLGSSNARRDIPRYLALWRTGHLDLEAMITGRRPLDEVGAALEDLAAGVGVRTVITP